MSSGERKAEKIYNNVTNKISKMLGHNGTTFDQELHRMGKKLFGVKFKGVFTSDKIPKLNELSPYAIVNLDRSGEPGSHWVAIAKKNNEMVIFDSFGRTKEILPMAYYSGNGRLIYPDNDPNQRVLETNCGQKSLSWLYVYDTYGWNVARHI